MLISKEIIYLVSVVATIQVLVQGAFILSGGIAIMLYGFEYIGEERCPKLNTILKVCAVSGILLVIIPSKETMCLMFLADYITVDNVTVTKEIMLTTIKEIKSALK